MLGLHCTHFLRPKYPSTPPPFFPIYLRTVHGPRQAWFYCPTLIVVQSAHHALPHSAPSQLWRSSVQLCNGPLRSCRKIRGKAAVQQSPSRRARRSPSLRCRMWLPRATRGQWKTTKTLQQPITQSWQHGAQTTSAHLYWCGVNPSGPWPALVANHGVIDPKGFTFSPFWRVFTNELINRIWNLISNATQNDWKEDVWWKIIAAGQIFSLNKVRRRQDLSNRDKMRRRPHFVTESSIVVCLIVTVCDSFFSNHNSEFYSFNLMMKSWINSWID